MFGVSLGDYEATIAVHKNGRTDVLANEGGERSTPMMVTYNKNNTLVGTPSKQALYRNYESTAISMIELLESSESELKSICERLNCKAELQNNVVSYRVPNIGLCSVKDALSLLLNQLAATARLCESVSRIPIVIATSKTHEQKTSLLSKCAQECGFDVIGMCSSPLLSLLPYGFGSQEDSFSGHILIYDIGVRTLQLLLVRADNGMLRRIQSQRYQDVGGIKLDEMLLTVLKSVGEKLFRKDVTISNKRASFKLLAAAEQAKHTLSAQNTTKINIESLSDGIDFQYSLSRGKFEGICLSVFKSFIEPVHSFIDSTGLTISDIEKVVLVGGTCKIPKLQQMLTDLFSNNAEILSTISPDHVAAIGAAMQGTYTTSNDITIPDSIPCIPNNITIECPDCVSDPSPLLLVPSHTPLPCRKSVKVSIKPKGDVILVLIVQETSSCTSNGEDSSQHDKSTIAQIKLATSALHISKEELVKLQIDFIWKSDVKKPVVLLVIKDLESDWRTEINLTK